MPTDIELDAPNDTLSQSLFNEDALKILSSLTSALENSNIEILTEALKNISELDLRGARLDNDAFAILCEALESNKTVTTLNLSNNNINTNSEIIAHIIYLLQTNSHLMALDIRANELGGINLCTLRDGILAINHRDMGQFKLQAQNNGLEAIHEGREINFWNKTLEQQSKLFQKKTLPLPKQAFYTPFKHVLRSKGVGDIALLVFKNALNLSSGTKPKA